MKHILTILLLFPLLVFAQDKIPGKQLFASTDSLVNRTSLTIRGKTIFDSTSIEKKLTMTNTSGTVGNMAGQFNWGTGGGINGNGLLFIDQGSTSTRAGFGNTTNGAVFSMFSKLNAGSMQFGLGVDASNISTSNSNFYLSSASTPTPVALTPANVTAFNGFTYLYNALPTTLTFFPSAAGTANAINPINFGNNTTSGMYSCDAGSTTLRAGLIYKNASGTSWLFGRGSFPFYFGVGFDESNMTASNAAFYINPVNRFFANGISEAIVAKTSTYIATTADATINYTSGTATITLPSSIGIDGTEYTIKNSGTGVITIQPNLNGIATLGAITGGSGYTNGTYTNRAVSNGGGSNAQANVTVSGGAVTAITITVSGKLYAVSDVVTVAPSLIGGTGSGFTVPVATLITQTIDGSTTKTLNTQYSGLRLQSDGANWIVIGAF